ncbi:MAG: LptF/LptG family permease [Pseudomonadota bacterium]
MIRRLDHYLAAHCLQVFVGLATLALTVLMLERLQVLFEITANTSDTLFATAKLVLMMVPNLLGLSIPLAFFLAILITVDRVSRSGELSACMAAGMSLFEVMRPFLVIGAGLSVVALLLSSYLEPLARYEYRKTIHDIEQRSIEAAFRTGKFTAAGDQVVWTQDRESGTGSLGSVFIYQDGFENGDILLTTARGGRVGPGADDRETRVTLVEGRAVRLSDERSVTERLSYERTDWAVGAGGRAFRPRGVDWQEQTLREMILAIQGKIQIGGPVSEAEAVTHARLGRATLLWILPFIAVTFGLGQGRSFSSSGVAVGIVFLVFLQKALETGQAMAASGSIPGWAGTWPTVGLMAAIAAWLFLRSAWTLHPPPLAALSSGFDAIAKFFARSPLNRASRARTARSQPAQ